VPDISHLDRRDLPSVASLLKATAVALGVAALLLVVAVLPAEYGIDPTGFGTRFGFAALRNATAAEPGADSGATPELPAAVASVVAVAPSEIAVRAEAAAPGEVALGEAASVLDAFWGSAAPYRNDEMSLTLKPGEGAEIKARMRLGERFVFNWIAEGGAVNFDMHGEALNARRDEFTSFRKGKNAAAGHGAFIAPFDGTHGWYWRNRGTQPVTVRVQTSGFYEKLFRPH